MRWGLWSCRFGALVVGVIAGTLYWLPHAHWFQPTDRHADVVACAVVVGVSGWLLVSLAIARRRERVRARVRPGLGLAAVAGAIVAAASSAIDAWPITAADVALVLAIGALGSVGVFVVPGSLRTDPWSHAEEQHD
ncbi:hypothetical protein ACVU7I_07280 [Patulibacter sp. S7RM1-6]